jgi:uncharacterized membrane protein YeiH
VHGSDLTAEFGTTLVVVDLVGVFAFAVTGALLGVRRHVDLFGILVLASVTGLGGGVLRDVLIGVVPPSSLQDWRYLAVPVLAGFVTFAFHPTVGRLEKVVDVFDAFGLALFCVSGAMKALLFDVHPVSAAVIGLLTAIGGGMIRDVLVGRLPAVFTGALYATPALAGAALTVALDLAGQPVGLVVAVGAGTCVVWRLLAMRLGWNAPLPRGNPTA